MRKGFDRLPVEESPSWRNISDELPSTLIPPDELMSRREAVALKCEQLERLPKVLDLLSDRERIVVLRHFGIGGTESSFAAIGSEIGVSKQRAGQLCSNAIRRLRTALKPQEDMEND